MSDSLKSAEVSMSNFLQDRPTFVTGGTGLIGGHCIGVDPFYLAKKAQEYGYNHEIILAGRRLNDSMGKYVATEIIKLMIKKGTPRKRRKSPDAGHYL